MCFKWCYILEERYCPRGGDVGLEFPENTLGVVIGVPIPIGAYWGKFIAVGVLKLITDSTYLKLSARLFIQSLRWPASELSTLVTPGALVQWLTWSLAFWSPISPSGELLVFLTLVTAFSFDFLKYLIYPTCRCNLITSHCHKMIRLKLWMSHKISKNIARQ